MVMTSSVLAGGMSPFPPTDRDAATSHVLGAEARCGRFVVIANMKQKFH
jgi:hypothetical protein